MAELKTILFTDIVGSVKLKGEMPGRSDTERDVAFIEQVLTPHRQRIEAQLAGLGGRVVSTAGDGHLLVFSDTVSAARWSVEIERSHRDEPIRTPKGNTVEVRISMHLGIPQLDPQDPDNFIGKPIDYAARLSDYATGGQILVSRSVVAVLEDSGMDGVSFHNHGRRELKGIGRVEVFELVYDDGGPHQMRPRPRNSFERQWTVLPATMGLTDFREPNGRSGGSGANAVGGRTSSDVIPLRLGNYELEQRLGSGGMGDVFRARHSQFGRVRAVKVIKQQFVDNGHDEVIQRFYHEIKAVGALEHPNIVVAIDSSAPTDSVHYLVMEYIEGIGADELVSRHGPLSVADACEIARQAARGLAYISQHGMVHRDIKPSNLMLTLVRAEPGGSSAGKTKPQAATQEAVVKILDLGLALLVGDDQQRLTVFDNRAMGTAMYMSPEQWKSSTVDIRADIYSLGCTLYHLLSGKPPFWESDLKPEKAHEREKVPPIEVDEDIPKPLWETLRRMMAKNPADRFEDPNEVVDALAPFAEGNHLIELIRNEMGVSHDASTEGVGKNDTRLAKSADSDTLARTSGWRAARGLSNRSRRKLRKLGSAILMTAAVLAIGWLVWQATARRRSINEALAARQQALELGARFAASEIQKEIDLRFETLSRVAADDELRQQMIEIKNKPTDTALWKKLDNWLATRKADTDAKAPSDSWFINDVRGVQVARSPRSDKSSGENYAYRDYFHGRGANLPPETKDLQPITAPHLSAAYRSTSTKHLKVAFSVPIENGKRGKAREVVGVLAMAVDLGEFNVLQNDLPAGHDVVLIDLRNTLVDGQMRRGLILHQMTAKPRSEDQPPPWISNDLLQQIDKILKDSDPDRLDHGVMLNGYRDETITGGKKFWGAIEPVSDQSGDSTSRDFKWVVLVQEPVDK